MAEISPARACGRARVGPRLVLTKHAMSTAHCLRRVLLDGVDVSTLDPDQLRRECVAAPRDGPRSCPEASRSLPAQWCVAVVPQEPVLLSGSLRDNIALGKPDATEEELRDAARRAGCDFALSGGAWEREVGEQGMQLSGGQRQRIALARVLLRPSPVVALDEFTAALDPATEAALLDSVEVPPQRQGCIPSSHLEGGNLDPPRAPPATRPSTSSDLRGSFDGAVGSATPIPPEVPSVAARRADFFASPSSMRRMSCSVWARRRRSMMCFGSAIASPRGTGRKTDGSP
mmetsp:Transcript_11417/g.36435  ORF Transcript_11417/g.36435 Transcript_11417/m.36435 type:complete len:288 (-) Transcript_11417:132-995(-)